MHEKKVDKRDRDPQSTSRPASLVSWGTLLYALYGIVLYLASVSGVGSSPSFLMNSLERRL
jgi:hypothetical protein